MGTLQINVLGTSFAIQAKEDSRYLENLLAYYKRLSEQIEQSSALKDPLKIAVLSGIMLCDELYKERQKLVKASKTENNDKDLFDAEELTRQLIEKLDKALQ